VKLRPGREPGERDGLELAPRLVDEATVAGTVILAAFAGAIPVNVDTVVRGAYGGNPAASRAPSGSAKAWTRTTRPSRRVKSDD
jgi:hypothetical protein